MIRTLAVLLLAPLAAAAQSLEVRPISCPAGPLSGEPNLVRGDDGRVYLSWIGRQGRREHALRFARFEKEGFGPSRTVARGSDWFVNWADFPSMAVSADGTLAAHWLQRNGDGRFAYGVRVACSTDGGRTWGEPFWLHEDRSPMEHGFVSMVPRPGGRFLAVWLDGRDFEKTRAMALCAVQFGPTGPAGKEAVLDAKVCECCATSMAAAGTAVVAVYRGRTAKEIRDIKFVRRVKGRWSKPATIHDDGWEMPG